MSGPAVIGMIRTAARVDATAASAQDARRAVDTLRRGLASAELVNPPTAVGADTYLEARDPGAPGGAATCRQWRVVPAERVLQARTWVAGTTAATAWVTVSTAVANTSAQPVFAVLPADGDWASARVVVDLRLQRTGGRPGPGSGRRRAGERHRGVRRGRRGTGLHGGGAVVTPAASPADGSASCAPGPATTGASGCSRWCSCCS